MNINKRNKNKNVEVNSFKSYFVKLAHAQLS